MTVRIGLIRHGPTDWNRAGRLQGRGDRPLDLEGLIAVEGWRLPAFAGKWKILSSPLKRARDTAAIVTGSEPVIDHRFIETDFGDWEGETLSDLRARLGAAMKAREDQGRDFRAPGGESPNDLINRLQPAYRDLANTGDNALIFCHKGIIRATMAWAMDWDMLGKPPVKLLPASLHIFTLGPEGNPTLEIPNLALDDGAS